MSLLDGTDNGSGDTGSSWVLDSRSTFYVCPRGIGLIPFKRCSMRL
jgi:hypothetical protein